MKKLLFITVVTLLSLLLCEPLSAQRIRSLDVTVFIDVEGDAYIRQVWDVNVTSGTEWYIPIGNLGKMTVSGLEVSENGQTFIDEGTSWDTDRSLQQKAGRSGIVDKGSDGVELCWGQGSYGDHVWTAGFVVLGLVQSLKDCDAFNFMFVNPDLVAPVERATVTLMRLDGKPFDTEYARFWFFGTEGKSEVRSDGTVFFETSGPMLSSDSIICMMRFDKGHFNPGIERNINFEKMQKKAFKGSSYKSEGRDIFDWLAIIVGIGFVLLFAGAILFMVFAFLRDIVLKIVGAVWSPKFFGARKIKGWEREAPFGGSIPVATYLMCDGTGLWLRAEKPESAIGAYFMKWIYEGVLVPVDNGSGAYNLKLSSSTPDFSTDCEESLYKIVKKAAGSNEILEKNEFNTWAEKHYGQVVGWPKVVKRNGKSEYEAFSGDKVAEAAKLLKFKNFLNEFTLSRERAVSEVALWGQYLVFAQLFGIADKVAKGLAKLYPSDFTEFSSRYGLDAATMTTVMHDWTRNSVTFYQKANDQQLSKSVGSGSSSSSRGFGGYSSRGGGGGFSGGGRGGGSR